MGRSIPTSWRRRRRRGNEQKKKTNANTQKKSVIYKQKKEKKKKLYTFRMEEKTVVFVLTCDCKFWEEDWKWKDGFTETYSLHIYIPKQSVDESI